MDVTRDRKKKFWIGLAFDLIGMLSYFFPLMDIVWAPLSAYLMVRMYPGATGKVGGLISFVEEAVPNMDFFPSFTLVWVYVYWIRKGDLT